uniref:Uncharacterized protein n=1 Tax=Arundo donax TaxID=35708 RepID=A0A0A9EUI7_ARUDO
MEGYMFDGKEGKTIYYKGILSLNYYSL